MAKTTSAPSASAAPAAPASKKSSKTAVAAVEVVVPVAAAPEVAAADVKQKKTKKVKSVEVEAAAPAVEVAAPVEAAAPVDEVAPVVEDTTFDGFALINSQIQQVATVINTLKTELRQLERTVRKDIKTAQKSSSKRKRKQSNRSPSGFVKPTRVSDELAVFLNVPVGTELARTVVTSEIDKYVKLNSLQDKENGRKILADAKLLALLNIDSSVELTYFNLQKYMRRHFQTVKKDDAPVA